MERSPNLARDWFELVLALVASVFAIRAFFSLIAILRPVRPTIEQDLVYIAVIVAGASIVLVLASRRFEFARRVQPFERRLIYAALAAGTLLALWALGGLPVHLAADKAFASDPICASIGPKDASSPLCHTVSGHADAAWIDKTSNVYYVSVVTPSASQSVELECEGDRIFALTLATTRALRVEFYGSNVARLQTAGLVCETTFAPSPSRTLGILFNAIFGLVVASYAAWLLWGERASRFIMSRRRRAKTTPPQGA